MRGDQVRSVDEEELTGLLRQAWDAYVGPVEGLVACAGDCPGHLSAGVSISGSWVGAVVLCSSAGLARLVASRMLAKPPEDVSPTDERDALAELVNVVGGSVKSLLPHPSELSLPWTSVGSGPVPAPRHGRGARDVGTGVRLAHDGEESLVLTVQPAPAPPVPAPPTPAPPAAPSPDGAPRPHRRDP